MQSSFDYQIILIDIFTCRHPTVGSSLDFSEYAVRLPQKIFHDNRLRFVEALRKQVTQSTKPLFTIRGDGELSYASTDTTFYPKPQNSWFYYLFGVKEPDVKATIDLNSGLATLFVPKMPIALGTWMPLMTAEDFQEKYGIDTKYEEDYDEFVKTFGPDEIFVVEGVNSDSGMKTDVIPNNECLSNYKLNKEISHLVLSECRVFKSPDEVIVMKQAYKMAAEAHMKVMKAVKPGKREDELSAVFISHCVQNYNQRILAYPTVICSGRRCSILHYFENSQIIPDNALMLTDMGMQMQQYASDITTTYPTNGKFTPKQREIYNLVLKANRAVQLASKPGVIWTDMQLLAEKIILTGLQEIGIIKEAANIDELVEKRVGFIFMPHGLGHLIGLDVHDVGGYLPQCPPRSPKYGLKSLRHGRELKPGMVTTNEPGCYFIEFLLDGKGHDVDLSEVNVAKAKEYLQVGGVRIEDAIVITENGNEILTPSFLPRTVAEIEAFMAQ